MRRDEPPALNNPKPWSRKAMRTVYMILLVFIALILIGSCSNSHSDSAQFFDKARTLIELGEREEASSFSNALRYYEEAMAIVDMIKVRYPASPVARRIVDGQIRIGSRTVSEFKDKVIAQLKKLAHAEDNFLACALFLADAIEDNFYRSMALSQVATAYAESDQCERALQIARALNDDSDTVSVLVDIARIYRERGKNPGEREKKILHQIIEEVDCAHETAETYD